MTNDDKKRYLNRAQILNISIQNKITLLGEQREHAAMASSKISPTPVTKTRNIHVMEDIIVEMLDLEADLNSDLLKMQKQKHEIYTAVRAVEDIRLQTVLELKYLRFMTWSDIAEMMGYSIQNIYKLHDKALSAVHIPETVEQNRAG